MRIYPAIKAKMGDWTYYIVKMRMREVAAEIKFGSDVYEDYTLNEALRRSIKPSQFKDEMAGCNDRFFSSLVIAAVGGAPKFHPVSIADDPQFGILADEPNLEESFGVLRFSGDPKYYAMDSPHRLKAIKTLLLPEDESEREEPPSGFENEEISVLMVVRPADSTEEDWLASYRRLFSSLNRYTKPTDRDTNIIMDEDDLFAILTRRLIATHEFFKAPGRHLESVRVQTKGRPLREGTSHFTSLQQLYDMNEVLLTTSLRSNTGWGDGPEAERVINLKHFMRFRPPEGYLDRLFEELKLYWDALIAVVPDLALSPSDARNHQADGSNGKTADNVLFWPIGQEVMTAVARALLDKRLPSPDEPTLEHAKRALNPLAKVDWRLHCVPWRGLLLVFSSDTKKWSMRNDDRKNAIRASEQLLRWITGIYQPTEQEEDKLKSVWKARLGPLPEDDSLDVMWEQIRAMRDEVSG